jgi:hypothetical protein
VLFLHGHARRTLVAIVAAIAVIFGLAVVAAAPASAGSAGGPALSWAKTQIGHSYQWGGAGPSYDCSGLTMRAYQHAGISLPHSSAQQYAVTRSHAVSRSQLQPGDLLFYGGSAGSIHHVGLYVGHYSDGQVELLDAQQTGVPVGYHHSYSDYYAATRPGGGTASAPPKPKPPAPRVRAQSTSARASGDFDGDGRSDLALFVSPRRNTLELWMWRSVSHSGSPSVGAKVRVWSGAGLDASRLRAGAGDLNGDRKADVVASYDDGNGWMTFYAWRSTSSGGVMRVAAPVKLREAHNTGWSTGTTRLLVADLNGDHKADVAAYVGSSANRLELWGWRSTGSTGGKPTVAGGVRLWAANGWSISRIRAFAGDENSDNKADVGLFYDRGSGFLRAWVWRSTRGGAGLGVAGPVMTRQGINPGWSSSSVQPMSVNIDGDSRSDIAAFVGWTAGQERLWVWRSTAGVGGRPSWSGGQRVWANIGWDAGRVMPFAGDVDGDRRGDVVAFYDYGGNHNRTWVFRSTTTGAKDSVAAPVAVRDGVNSGWSTASMRVS